MKAHKKIIKIAGLVLLLSLSATLPAKSKKNPTYEDKLLFCMEQDKNCHQRRGSKGSCQKKGRRRKDRDKKDYRPCDLTQAQTTSEPSMIIAMLILTGLTGLVYRRKKNNESI